MAALRPQMLAFAALLPAMSGAAPPAADPYLWLEQVSSPRALAWVDTENARTLPVLENDPRYAGLYADAVRILEATDRIPAPDQIGGDIVNLWQDATHVQGVWRRTTPASYLAPAPAWRTLIDLDALSAAEGVKLVWKGADCEPVTERRCMVSLSAGGEDAVTAREFDLHTGAFVPGGFTLPTSKQELAWETPDRLLVARDWGAGTMTTSGYPYVVKRLDRGRSLTQAAELFRGEPSDVGVALLSLVDGAGNRLLLIERDKTFFESEVYRVGPRGVTKLDLPAKLTIGGLVDGRLIFVANQDWTPPSGPAVAAGSIVAVPATRLGMDATLAPEILFAPGPRQSVETATVTRGHVLAAIYDNVRGQGWTFDREAGRWAATRLALPDNASVHIVSSDRSTDQAYLGVQSFLVPPSLWLADAATGTAHRVKSSPARFDATGLVTEQFEATSTDGMKIPYFVVHRADVRLDGSTPTLLNAYGGFQLSETPYYLNTRGKLWVEKGGAFALANIRGGGEFGPAWHDAGLKAKRQIVYDDFAAVGQDLIRRGLTSSRRLGIYGGSNGGLLMGVEMTQRPDLWHAIAIEIPLLDMLRYERLSAGSSWIDEYGSVADPEVRAFWEKTSPYQALRRDGGYPVPFIWTTTKDDRVGPAQARKFAARMKEYGLPYLYWENREGGHAAGANLRQSARAQALETTYFMQRLMDR